MRALPDPPSSRRGLKTDQARALEDAAEAEAVREEQLHGVDGRDGHHELDHLFDVDAEHGNLLVLAGHEFLLMIS